MMILIIVNVMLISEGMHFCVIFVQNNSGSVEMIGGCHGCHYCVKFFGVICFSLKKMLCKTFWNSWWICVCCLKKQFFKGVVHEQYWSSIICLLWGSSSVSSCCLRWQIFKQSFYPFPLLKFFLLLSVIVKNAQFPKIYDALSKPNLKKQKPNNFSTGSPWATLILIVCLLWGSSIVSSFFLKQKKNPFLRSFSFPLLILFSF